ncbi:hypothetical protein [Telluribacter sp. SYSU D00476]|uniref:hypothetical protein n=1 Tax=Telluribacter sp. SYSU D00476 TaxID=2811430 RepID=UPI001FF3985F|nr:hypothetical protein [Telluribacter sp. SYSU D00476]
MKKLILLSLLGMIACKDPFCEKRPDEEVGLIEKVLAKDYLAYEQNTGDLARNGIHISSAEQYRQVFSYCCATRLDSIDFSRYDLLGLTTVNRGSNSSYRREVRRDDTNKKIIYTITEHYCQKASPVDGQGNFVVIPKVPADYRVEYIRNN